MPYQFPLTVKYDNNGKPIGLTETNSVSVSAVSATTLLIDEAVIQTLSAVSSNVVANLDDYTFALNTTDFTGSPKTAIKVAFFPVSSVCTAPIIYHTGTVVVLANDGSSLTVPAESEVTHDNLNNHLLNTNIHWHLSTLNSYFINTSGDTMTGTLNAPVLSSVQYADFNLTAAPAATEGRLRWNDDFKTLEVDSAGNDFFRVGQEVSIRIENKTGDPLTPGTVVYVSGYQGNVPTVGLASASSEGKSHRGMGVVKTTINNNNRGLMIVKGVLSGVNTSGFTQGEIVKLDTVPGKYRSGLTTAPSHNEWIGSVVKTGTGTTDGILFVDIQHGYEIHELHDVSRVSAADHQTLVWNGTSSIYEPKHIYNTIPFTISDPSSITYKTLFYAKNINAISEINSVIAGASPSSVGWTLWLASDVTDPEAGTQIATDTTSSTTIGDTVSGTTIGEGWVVIAIDNTNGSVSELHISLLTY